MNIDSGIIHAERRAGCFLIIRAEGALAAGRANLAGRVKDAGGLPCFSGA
jgi:hypothetical protein